MGTPEAVDHGSDSNESGEETKGVGSRAPMSPQPQPPARDPHMGNPHGEDFDRWE